MRSCALEGCRGTQRFESGIYRVHRISHSGVARVRIDVPLSVWQAPFSDINTVSLISKSNAIGINSVRERMSKAKQKDEGPSKRALLDRMLGKVVLYTCLFVPFHADNIVKHRVQASEPHC
jgi:hypothetical protein